MSPTEVTLQRMTIRTKDRVYIADSEAFVHKLGKSSLSPKEKRTIRKSEHLLAIQTANGTTLSKLRAKKFL